MNKNRLEAFSDGVMAIIITIMVLEMKVPRGDDFVSLEPLAAVFISYALSFTYIAIYWNNHHHLLHTVQQVNGPTLWANMFFLFWLSLIPFVTAWMGTNSFHQIPVALYGFVLLMVGIAYWNLIRILIKNHGKDSLLAKAIGKDYKSKASLISYSLAVLLAFSHEWISLVLYSA